MPDRAISAFDQFSKLPESLHPAAKEVTKMSGKYVIIVEEKPTGFGWNAFKKAVVDRPGTDLTFDRMHSTVITNQTASVNDMAGKIVKFLADVFAAKMDEVPMRAQITAAFQNLQEHESRGFLSFSTSSEKKGSSWEYRVVFALVNPDTTESFYALVSTIKLSADIFDATGWFGITSESRHDFSADITAMELIVDKHFRRA